jgi:hypothetical protein
MKTNSMPGFTSEASLHEVTKGYSANRVVSSTNGSAVVPQLRRLGTGFWNTLRPKSFGPVAFQCGWNSKTLTSECTCAGDADCNRMFTSGFCGGNASCDTGAGTCRCDLKL